ncbi:hypothetical protein C942_00005 [Photobacterium marinum]|uniref:Diguanylate cyclase n=1 Tax=Photobacterium marinum TaxID=1056511 RepID=L8JHH3_9GAMM|nr:bifunctional diguanylate cyclase/phosphodiesterase [Photobacterium marinum]ELR67698.1 hypothetical protein C942_00005 [Photobacterium marinum]
MRAALFRFIALLFPLLAITAGSAFYIYHQDVKQLEQRIMERERNIQQSTLHITRLHFAPIIDDLRYLTQKIQEVSNNLHNPAEKKDIVTNAFKRMILTRSFYDQVRLINDQGKEVIRINMTDGKAVQVDDNMLQDKSHRPYVSNALKIEPGTFYTSEFDLNMENGQIEEPTKPMLRFVSHFVVNGRSWLIALNYLGYTYLEELNNLYQWTHGQNWLINKEGQWLLGPEAHTSWQFMPGPNGNLNNDFFDNYPDLWNKIQTEERGQMIEGDFLFTYTRFFSGDKFQGDELFTLPFDGSDLPWTVISKIDMSQAVMELAFTRERIIRVSLLATLVLSLCSGCAVLSWHLLHLLRHEQKLKQENQDVALQYSTVLKHVPDGLLTIDRDMTINTINKAAGRILNINDDSAPGKSLLKLISGDKNRQQIKELVEQIHNSDIEANDKPIKVRIKLSQLKTRYIEFIATETHYSNRSEILLNFRDVTYWIEREEKLKSMSRALEQSNDSIIITNNQGIVEYVNQAFEKFNGIKSRDILGAQSSALLKETLDNDKEVRAVQDELKEGKTINRVIARRQADDSIIYEERTISPIRNNRGRISHYISTGKDITERILFENKLHKLAHYDLLTELPNRTLLLQYIESAMIQARKEFKSIALLTIDLDHFKQINDSFSHDIGDKVLTAIAQRIEHTLREGDLLARLGGDEFAIVIKSDVSPENIANLADRIINHIREPLCVENKELLITASMGISLFPDDSNNVDNLFKNADIALYRAKEKNRNQFCFFTRQMGLDNIKRIQLESELRKSIGTDRYELYYQPKINAATRKICGVEALLRWKDEKGQIRSPVEFIPVLENSGLIIEVGEYLIHQACHQLQQWHQKGFNIRFALNISARQLLNSNLVRTVQSALSESGCDPHSLELEITESVIMCDVTTALDKLVNLEKLGVKISIDDFGTGYSSLAYLSRFPIHILKIDREFIKDLPENKDNISITRSIVELAHNLKMQVVAEGVETKAQQEFLDTLGVEEFQGFYFGSPMPLSEFERLYIEANESAIIQ